LKRSEAVVVIGGGTGAPHLVKALAERRPETPLAIVCPVTDSGRSTGAARKLFNIPAPGDLRHCLSTLAGDRRWADVLEHRLAAGPDEPLNGMAVGNLVLGALTEAAGDIGSATERLSSLLHVGPSVLPASVDNLQLEATLADDRVVAGELAVRETDKPPISEVRVTGARQGAWPPTTAALADAGWIVLGPGSLWTSVAATLVVPGLGEAVRDSPARVVFVCNTTTQPGQTDGLTLRDHVDIVTHAAHRRPDIVIANDRGVRPEAQSALAADGLSLILPRASDQAELAAAGIRLVTADLVGSQTLSASLWQKLPTAYHDMATLADLLSSLMAGTLIDSLG
jgi:uncharacterized cofD-like protein